MWTSGAPQNSYVETESKDEGVRRRGLCKVVGSEEWALVDGICVHIKEAQGPGLSFSPNETCKTQLKDDI